jgi:hypothetical protein
VVWYFDHAACAVGASNSVFFFSCVTGRKNFYVVIYDTIKCTRSFYRGRDAPELRTVSVWIFARIFFKSSALWSRADCYLIRDVCVLLFHVELTYFD